MKEKKKTAVWISMAAHKRLKAYSLRSGRQMKWLLEQLVFEALTEDGFPKHQDGTTDRPTVRAMGGVWIV